MSVTSRQDTASGKASTSGVDDELEHPNHKVLGTVLVQMQLINATRVIAQRVGLEFVQSGENQP